MSSSGIHCKRRRLLALASAMVILTAAPLAAATLSEHTLEAWNEYVRLTEERIDRELRSSQGFLAQDFQVAHKAAADRKAVLSGNIVVTRIKSFNGNGGKIRVPRGTIQHWRGAVFIPRVSLALVLARLRNPPLDKDHQEDVLEARILERRDDVIRLYLKLVRSNIVTATYNTEHLVHYRRHSGCQASSRSIAIKIAELEHTNTPAEREKPEGVDRGFLWRLNSYWRYQQVNEGVLVECESLSLSRKIPFILVPVVRPPCQSDRASVHESDAGLDAREVFGERSPEPDRAIAFASCS